jgi:hypothetical protein
MWIQWRRQARCCADERWHGRQPKPVGSPLELDLHEREKKGNKGRALGEGERDNGREKRASWVGQFRLGWTIRERSRKQEKLTYV